VIPLSPVESFCVLLTLPATKNATATMCGANIRTKPDVITYLPLTVTAFASVLLRIFSKHRLIGAGSFGTDDATIIVAAVSYVLAYISNLSSDAFTAPSDTIRCLLQYMSVCPLNHGSPIRSLTSQHATMASAGISGLYLM
jgi:hypothetical protein